MRKPSIGLKAVGRRSRRSTFSGDQGGGLTCSKVEGSVPKPSASGGFSACSSRSCVESGVGLDDPYGSVPIRIL